MIRKITSLTALLSFILLMLTSVILYIVPAGRVAYWADYHLWGLTKGEWGNLHINLGVLLLFAIILHTYYNWNAITAYMKNKTREFKLFTREFNVALMLVVLFCLGTYFEVPPLSTIIKVGESISADAEKFYGEPPYGHAELSSLKTFSKKMDLDLELSMQRLKDAGLIVTGSDQSLSEIAGANQTSPQQIFQIISPVSERVSNKFPSQAPAGLGNRPLIDLCQEYSVSSKTVLQILADHDIQAQEKMSIKEIAEIAGKDALSIYELIREELEAANADAKP
ncbi:MAG: DUF4405 domain-containing protein [Desulfuromonadales bacterium]|nr:DUF4405 domain-containing protein [Desulfuromonadales bacterium]